jgi:hypothetical protein
MKQHTKKAKELYYKMENISFIVYPNFLIMTDLSKHILTLHYEEKIT